MNMLATEVRKFALDFSAKYIPPSTPLADCGFAAPFTVLTVLKESFASQPSILLGAQNAHWLDSGAHTGEISAPMLKDCGVQFVIVGHSERRQFYGETDQAVAKRTKAVIAHGLLAVVCIGETREEFEGGKTLEVVKKQLLASLEGITAEETNNLVIAYEPVWAIGTGLAATPEIAASVHNFIRELLIEMFGDNSGATIRILYGGSTTADNVSDLMAQPNINGALVGGASLKAEGFADLVKRGRSIVSMGCACCCGCS